MYRRTDPATSRFAAEAMLPGLSAFRKSLVEYLLINGDSTHSEVEVGMGLQKNSAQRRLGELYRMGILYRYSTRWGVFPGDKPQFVYTVYPLLW